MAGFAMAPYPWPSCENADDPIVTLKSGWTPTSPGVSPTAAGRPCRPAVFRFQLSLIIYLCVEMRVISRRSMLGLLAAQTLATRGVLAQTRRRL